MDAAATTAPGWGLAFLVIQISGMRITDSQPQMRNRSMVDSRNAWLAAC